MFLLQTPLAALECTQAIMNSDEAQTMLKNFSHQTGMIIHQKLLNLHTFWPARRVRWWGDFLPSSTEFADDTRYSSIGFSTEYGPSHAKVHEHIRTRFGSPQTG